MAIITVYISNEYFNGFKRNVNIIEFSSFKELCDYMKDQLVSYLKLENLNSLADKANSLELHTHEYKFYNDFKVNVMNNKVDYVYLCCHK
jgi:hypothetical protein